MTLLEQPHRVARGSKAHKVTEPVPVCVSVTFLHNNRGSTQSQQLLSVARHVTANITHDKEVSISKG